MDRKPVSIRPEKTSRIAASKGRLEQVFYLLTYKSITMASFEIGSPSKIGERVSISLMAQIPYVGAVPTTVEIDSQFVTIINGYPELIKIIRLDTDSGNIKVVRKSIYGVKELYYHPWRVLAMWKKRFHAVQFLALTDPKNDSGNFPQAMSSLRCELNKIAEIILKNEVMQTLA